MKTLVQRHSLLIYFGFAYLFSWGSGLIVLGPKVLRGEAIQPLDALLLFPVLVLGVALTGFVLTGVRDGRDGIRKLFARIGTWRVSTQWYAAALLTAPTVILVVLISFRALLSPVYAPKFFPLGFLFGIFPGFLEEIGWTGFAFPIMRSRQSALAAGIGLGVLWGLWHLPVVDYLGGAAPHGAYWLPFFLAFITLMTAMRVLIVWVYSNTQSLLLAQLMHTCSTGFLVVLSPAQLSPSQETLWYAVYAVLLWILVAIVGTIFGKDLVGKGDQE